MRLFISCLLLGDAVVIALHFWLGTSSGFFNVDSEQNLISLYSGVQLMLVTSVVTAHLWLWQKLGLAFTKIWAWFMAGAGFLWIALDDMMALHERITFAFNKIFSTGGFYADSFNWLWYFLPLVGGAVYVYSKLIYDLWLYNKTAARAATLALGLWLVALAIEWWSQKLLTGSIIPVAFYKLLIPIEEAVELLGITAWVYALVINLRLVFNKHFRLV